MISISSFFFHFFPHVGKILVLHSVTVEQAFRRKRIGQRMMLDYLQYIKGIDNIEEVMLLSKAYLLEFYIRCGFAVTKLSPIVHGNVRKKCL